MKSKKTAIKTDLFAADLHHQKLDQLGDPLLRIGACIDFTALAAQVDSAAPRPVSTQVGHPPYPTEVMVRILVLKRLYNLSDEQMAYQLLDRHQKQITGIDAASNLGDYIQAGILPAYLSCNGPAKGDCRVDHATADVTKHICGNHDGQSIGQGC